MTAYIKPICFNLLSKATLEEYAPRVLTRDVISAFYPQETDLLDDYTNCRKQLVFNEDDDAEEAIAAAQAHGARTLMYNLEGTSPIEMTDALDALIPLIPTGYMLEFAPLGSEAVNRIATICAYPQIKMIGFQCQKIDDADLVSTVSNFINLVRPLRPTMKINVQTRCDTDTAQIIANARALEGLRFHCLTFWMYSDWSDAYTVLQELRPDLAALQPAQNDNFNKRTLRQVRKHS